MSRCLSSIPAILSGVLCGLIVSLSGPACTGANTGPKSGGIQTVSEPTLLALTPTEYNNTVRDLLGMPYSARFWPQGPGVFSQEEREAEGQAEMPDRSPWPWQFPAEAGVESFEGMADGQFPSPYLIEEYQKAATHFASFVLVSPIFFTCDGWSSLSKTEQRACAWESIKRFAMRAWRSPMSDEQEARLASFWEQHWADGTPEEAVVFTVEGILQSPNFLYRIERGHLEGRQGKAVPLTDWEMAARLSYFLWDSLPDPELYEAAYRGALSTREGVEAQAKRMLLDPRARSVVTHFHNQWLGTTEIHRIAPARRAYGPLFGLSPTPPLDTTGDEEWPDVLLNIRKSMAMETELFVEQVVFEGEGSFRALLTHNQGYMSDATKLLYGPGAKALDGPAVALSTGESGPQRAEGEILLRPTEFPPDQRSGVLTLPSVLALRAHPVHPAPILRGTFVLHRLACEDPGQPPPGTECLAPPDTVEVASTNRERTEAVTSSGTCAACHKRINPPGFAFEHYDSMGVWRSEDNGQEVDASGSFSLENGEVFTFERASDLVAQLALSDAVRDCYVLRWARYATGAQLPETHGQLELLQESFRANDQIQDLLISITGSDLFRYRAYGGAP